MNRLIRQAMTQTGYIRSSV